MEESIPTPKINHTSRKTVTIMSTPTTEHIVGTTTNNNNNKKPGMLSSSSSPPPTGPSQKGGESSSGQQSGGATTTNSNKNKINVVKGQKMIIAGNRDSAPFEPSVEDQVATGTITILQSPHVSEGPGRVANAPVPSVFNDDRGHIHRLRVGGKRMNLLFSKEGVLRSGYLHPEKKHDFVFSGKVELWFLTPQGTTKQVYGPLEHFMVPAYVPHIFQFHADTVMAEWWAQPAASACWLYHPYRRIVDVHNSMVSKSTGQHQLLVPQDDDQYIKFQSLQSSSGLRSFFWWTTGLTMGVGLGAFLATSVMAHSRRR